MNFSCFRNAFVVLRNKTAQVGLFLLLLLHLLVFISFRVRNAQVTCSGGVESSVAMTKISNETISDTGQDISGLSLVEISVRPSAFSDLDASRTYDLFFSGPGRSGTIQSESVYDWILIDSYEQKTSTVRIFVPRQDVAVLLTLERLGEFRLVAAAKNESAVRPRQQEPLEERQWVRTALGLDTVEELQ